MRHTVVMPPLGDAAGELVLARWLRAPGDRIAKGEELFEVETDKVTVPVESLYAGVVVELLLDEGASAAEGDPIATIDDGAG